MEWPLKTFQGVMSMDESTLEEYVEGYTAEDIGTIYERKMVERLLEDDEIDPIEAAFMCGYNNEEET